MRDIIISLAYAIVVAMAWVGFGPDIFVGILLAFGYYLVSFICDEYDKEQARIEDEKTQGGIQNDKNNNSERNRD